MAGKRQAMIMVDMTIQELDRALKRTQTAILPVALCEQHGFHLPLGTDIINAEQFSRRLAQRYPCVVAPTVNYTYSGGELTGTINVHPHVITRLIDQIILSLYRQGFRRVGVLAGHGGGEHIEAIRATLELLLRQNPDKPDLQIIWLPVWEFSDTWQDAMREGDFHAGRIETSLMLYWCPEKVRPKIVMDAEPVARELRERAGSCWNRVTRSDSPYEVPHVRQSGRMKVGVMGFPHEATAELGRQVNDQVVAGMLKLFRDLDRQARQSKRPRVRPINAKVELILRNTVTP